MLFAIAVILILIADQGLKYWVTLSIPLDDGVRALFPGFLELRNIHNTGAAFSLLAGAPRWIFILLAVIFIVIIVLAVRREWVHGAFGRWMAILLLAGALGNCLDRMLSGYVVDMLAFEFWPRRAAARRRPAPRSSSPPKSPPVSLSPPIRRRSAWR